MKIYLLTYGDNGFYLSKKHLEYLAINSGLFDRVISLGPKDLDNKFKKNIKKYYINQKVVAIGCGSLKL